MKITYDKEADAAYIYLTSHRAKVSDSREIEDGIVIDLDKEKNAVGIEILDVSHRFKPADLFQFSVQNLTEKIIV